MRMVDVTTTDFKKVPNSDVWVCQTAVEFEREDGSREYLCLTFRRGMTVVEVAELFGDARATLRDGPPDWEQEEPDVQCD